MNPSQEITEKIMRGMGYVEVKAIEMFIDSAKNTKSEMVKFNARAILAKCLGLHQDVVAVNQGIQIIIKGREPVEQAPGRSPPGPPSAGKVPPGHHGDYQMGEREYGTMVNFIITGRIN
jgi:hypothetical protein